MAKQNPYIAGNPVGGGEAFIGRADVLRDVLRMLKNSKENGIVLYGQRRIGKTSVLLELAAHVAAQGHYAPVYFDLQDKAAKSLDDVLLELADRIVRKLDLPPWNPPNHDIPTGFQRDFLPAILAQLPPETVLVLLFDEFDVLDNPQEQQAVSAFFPYLRELMAIEIQQMKFVFVIGRRPEDLSSFTLSVFKGVKSRHVSLLSQKDTVDLVRLSERNESLTWPDEAAANVYELTGGHPFLAQQLCQVLWDQIYDDAPQETPSVQLRQIEQAVPDALKSSTNSLEWLWDGLKPAQRVVASALAEAGSGMITQAQLERCLQESGVRILIGELQDAPRVLEEWDLIRMIDGGYCFPAEMLRRWITERKPLKRVQDEIDRILPVADNLFHAGFGLYQKGQIPQAIALLQQALGLNPNHLKANQELAALYLADNKVDEALKLLETLYEYHPAAARPRLVQAWLLKAQATKDEKQQGELYEKILGLEPNHAQALTLYQKFWEKRGDQAYKKEDLQAAFEAYTKAQMPNKIATVERLVNIAKTYQEALEKLEQGAQRKAQKLLAKVLAVEPTFREAARYMYLAVTGVDPTVRITELEQQVQALTAPPTGDAGSEDLESLLDLEGVPGAADLQEVEVDENMPLLPDARGTLAIQEFTFETVTVNARGEIINRENKKARQLVEDLGNGVTLEMVAIPDGTFLMGQTEAEKKRLIELAGKDDYQKYYARELPQHEVRVQEFWLGKYPVTQAQWEATMGKNPANFKGEKRPVEQVSWNDAQKFLKKLNDRPPSILPPQAGGQRGVFRLPSEAEWEYACRAGTTTPFYFGETITTELANYNGNATYAAESKSVYREQTTDVGGFPPNAFGLYDMHGNVWEWCADPWHENYKGAPTDGSVWEKDGNTGIRLLRGGSWPAYPLLCRCAFRDWRNPDVRIVNVGLRVVVFASRTL